MKSGFLHMKTVDIEHGEFRYLPSFKSKRVGAVGAKHNLMYAWGETLKDTFLI